MLETAFSLGTLVVNKSGAVACMCAPGTHYKPGWGPRASEWRAHQARKVHQDWAHSARAARQAQAGAAVEVRRRNHRARSRRHRWEQRSAGSRARSRAREVSVNKNSSALLSWRGLGRHWRPRCRSRWQQQNRSRCLTRQRGQPLPRLLCMSNAARADRRNLSRQSGCRAGGAERRHGADLLAGRG